MISKLWWNIKYWFKCVFVIPDDNSEVMRKSGEAMEFLKSLEAKERGKS